MINLNYAKKWSLEFFLLTFFSFKLYGFEFYAWVHFHFDIIHVWNLDKIAFTFLICPYLSVPTSFVQKSVFFFGINFCHNKLEVFSDLFCSIGSCDRPISHCNDYCNYVKSLFITKSGYFHHIHLLKIILINFAIVGPPWFNVKFRIRLKETSLILQINSKRI